MDVRGYLSDVRSRIASRVASSYPVRLVKSDMTRVGAVLGGVILAMTLSAAGILSGLGLFLMMMIQMDALAVVGSALLLASSTTVFLSCYFWLAE